MNLPGGSAHGCSKPIGSLNFDASVPVLMTKYECARLVGTRWLDRQDMLVTPASGEREDIIESSRSDVYSGATGLAVRRQWIGGSEVLRNFASAVAPPMTPPGSPSPGARPAQVASNQAQVAASPAQVASSSAQVVPDQAQVEPNPA